MLKKVYIKDGELAGHSYYRDFPLTDNWYYDRFGRYPGIGDLILYVTSDEDTGLYSMRLGLIVYSTKTKGNFGFYIDTYYFAPLKSPEYQKPGERAIGDYGKTGLVAYSPLLDLSYVRNLGGIVLLDSTLYSNVSPHML